MSGNSAVKKSLAILPFRSHHGRSSSDEVLKDGLADALAVRLFGVENLELIPSNSIRQQLAKTNDSFKLGKLLKVDYILEGYIFPVKERTRFTVQLLDVPNRSVLWGAQFDENEPDVFKLEDRISERIAKAILPHLEITEKDPVTDSVPVPDTGEIKEEVLHKSGAETIIYEPKKSKTKRAENRTRFYVMITLAAILGSFLIWRLLSPPKENLPNGLNAKTLIILPFQNTGTQTSDDTLGIGLAETLTGNLGNVKKLFVLSPNAGRDASRMNISASQIGRDFNVDYLLRGNLQRVGDGGELQIYAELLEAKDEKVLWSENLKVSDGDISNLQSSINVGVLNSLEIQTDSLEKQKISKKLTDNGLAYELYLAGRYQMATRTHGGLHRAISAFTEALNRDPNFALAMVGLGDAYGLENLYEIPAPDDAWTKAKANILQALKLDENLAEAHASLGYILANHERNYAEAEKEFQRAIELNPSYATTYHWYAVMLTMLGKHDAALEKIEIAGRLDPRSAIITSAKGMLFFYARQYEKALEQYQKTFVEIDPGFVPAHKMARWTYQAMGNYPAALAAFQKEKNFSGSTDAPGWLVIEAQVEAMSSDKKKARETLDKALAFDEVSNQPGDFAYEIALAYAGLDEREKTFEWLKKAEESNTHSINFLDVDPRFDKYRNDERFSAIVKKVKNS